MRYLEIADDLRGRILDGAYRAGARLPSNRALAARYDTTLATLRSALQLLAEDGWVRIEHGNGTFVGDLGADAEVLASLSAEDLAGASALETRVVRVATAACGPGVASALGLAAGDVVAQVDRVRLVDGRPLIFQSSSVPRPWADRLADYDGRQPLYVFLREHAGVVAASSREHVEARVISPEAAVQLGQPLDAVVLRSTRTSLTYNSQPVLFDDAQIASGPLTLVIERRGRACRAGFELDPDRGAHRVP